MGIQRIKKFVSVLLLLSIISEHCQAVTITKLPLPGTAFEPIIGKGIATFLTPDEAARVRRQQTSDVIRASYNTDKEPSDTSPPVHRREPGFYGGRNSADQNRNRFNQGYGSNGDEENDRRGGQRNNYNYKNEIPGGRRYQEQEREYYPKYERDGNMRKFSPCRGPRCGSESERDDNLPPRVLFISPDPGYHTSLNRRVPGYSGDERRYEGNDERGQGGYQGNDRRAPWEYQGNEYQGTDLRRGPRPENYPGGGMRWESAYRNTDPPGELNRVDRLQGGIFYGEPDSSDRDRRPSNRNNRRYPGDGDYSRSSGSDRYLGNRDVDSRRSSSDVRTGRWSRECRDSPGGRGCQVSEEALGTVGFYGIRRRN